MSSAPDADLNQPRPLGQSTITESPSLSIASLHAPLAQPLQQSGPRTHEALCQALFCAASPLPRSDSFLFEQKYSWRDCGPTPPCARFKIGALQAERLLPPDPTDYTDRKTCKDFNRFVRQTRPEELYPLVPPKTSLRCAHGQEITLAQTGRRVWQQCPTLLQGWSHAELRLNGEGANSYSAYCLEHRGQEDHASSRKRQREDFDLFRETESHFASSLPGEKSSTKRSPGASTDERVPGNQIRLDTGSTVSGSSDLTVDRLVHGRWQTFDRSQILAMLGAGKPTALADEAGKLPELPALIPRDLKPEGLSRTATRMPTEDTRADATSETATRKSPEIWFDDWLKLDEHPREEELDELERRLFDEPVSGEDVGDLRTQDHDSLDAPHDAIPE